MENKLFRSSFVKFLIVGVINTAVGTSVMFLLYNLAGVSYWPSVCGNYLCGGIVSYFLNKYFTFQNTERSLAQVGRFVATVAVCMVVAYGIAKPAVRLALADYGPGERGHGGRHGTLHPAQLLRPALFCVPEKQVRK